MWCQICNTDLTECTCDEPIWVLRNNGKFMRLPPHAEGQEVKRRKRLH